MTMAGPPQTSQRSPLILVIAGLIALLIGGLAGGVVGWVAASNVQGTPGPAGADGVNGTDGSPGADGADGVAGVPGSTGANGAAGPRGQAGAPGSPGIDGTDGTNGTDGSGSVSSALEVDTVEVTGSGVATGPNGPFLIPWTFNTATAKGPSPADYVFAPDESTITVPGAGWYQVTFNGNCSASGTGVAGLVLSGGLGVPGGVIAESGCSGASSNRTTLTQLVRLDPATPITVALRYGNSDAGEWDYSVVGTLIIVRLS